MWRYLVGGVLFVAMVVELPKFLDAQTQPEKLAQEQTTKAPPAPTDKQTAAVKRQVRKPVSRTPATNYGRVVQIKADARGHFVTSARFNGRAVEVMVDTGATSVAINRKTARRIGMTVFDEDFKYVSNTANGQVKIAVGTIDEIRIGRITVHNVRAAILPDRSLNGILLGNSFLTELSEYRVRDGYLHLKQ